MSTYKDDEWVQLDNEFEQIQQCIGMYMAATNEAAAVHLAKEILNNSVDELTSAEVTSRIKNRVIDVNIDEVSKMITIMDSGRGMPFDVIVSAFTKKHGSTKFGRHFNKFSAGQNGVGCTLVAALSTYLCAQSFRDGQCKRIEFQNCKLKEYAPVKTKKSDPQHGTMVQFIPNEKYIGKINLEAEMLEDWIRRMSYMIPEGITFRFVGIKKGKDAMINKTYTKQTLSDNVTYLSPTLEFPPVEVESEEVEYDGQTIKMNMAFSYDKTVDGELIDAYCNFVHNTDGGYHVDACRRAICDFLVKEAKNADPNNKYEVSYDDCKKGLIMSVLCFHTEPNFGGQSKDRVDNKTIGRKGREIVVGLLREYFSNNQALLKRIITYLRQVAKARLQTNQIRGITAKKTTTFLEDAMIQGFENVADRNRNGYKELFLVEGISALGSLINVRNPTYQAVLSIFGVIDNTVGLTTANAMNKKSIQEIVNVLGCGIGPSFDISKLRWNKIIIASDADVDGFNITSNICAFFICHMPELVKAGYVYKALPPLYVSRDPVLKKMNFNSFISDKKEYIDMFNQIVTKSVDMMLPEDKDSGKYVKLSSAEKMRWLTINKNYLDEMTRIIKRCGFDFNEKYMYILEKIIETLMLVMGNRKTGWAKKFKEEIEKVFPEMTYSVTEESLEGSYDSTHITLIVDKLFLKLCADVIDMLHQNVDLYIQMKGVNDDNYTEYTIGTAMMKLQNRYSIRIDSRFKGLSEINADLMFKTVTNPLYRKLVRLTTNDITKAEAMAYLLHSRKNAEDRRNLLDNMKISYDDIDN